MHSRMLGRSGSSDYFCYLGAKCWCERRASKSHRRNAGRRKNASRKQLRTREKRQLVRELEKQ